MQLFILPWLLKKLLPRKMGIGIIQPYYCCEDYLRQLASLFLNSSI